MPDATEPDEVEKPQDIKLSRRGALARLGLTAATVYVAPTIFHIDRDAQAFVIPSPCSTGRGRRRRGCKRKGGGKNTEFGPKINAGMTEGFVRADRIDFNAFNECAKT